MIEGCLQLFVLFHSPSDYPAKLVVRLMLICKKERLPKDRLWTKEESDLPTGPWRQEHPSVVCPATQENLNALTSLFGGLHWVERSPGDDPPIVGMWI